MHILSYITTLKCSMPTIPTGEIVNLIPNTYLAMRPRSPGSILFEDYLIYTEGSMHSSTELSVFI